MKTVRGLLITLILASQLVLAQQKTEPAHKMVEFHMALLKRGPKWTAADAKRLQPQHVEYVTSMVESGKAVIAGPLTDGGEIDGVFVFRAKSAEEAKAWGGFIRRKNHRVTECAVRSVRRSVPDRVPGAGGIGFAT